MSAIRLLPSGDRALVVAFGSQIDAEINNQVHALAKKLTQKSVPGIEELVPTFCSLLIHYDPTVLKFHDLCQTIEGMVQNLDHEQSQDQKIWQIPCCYGSHFGPDLADMQQYTGLTRDEIIFLHSQVNYKIFMLGFLPGFVYLGGLDPRLEIPRLSTPRLRIPQGSVGIGGRQTGVYPMESPGGWRLIGSTPVDFYSSDRETPVLCQAGDYIRFIPISSSEYYDIRQMIQKGTYTVKSNSITAEGSE